MLLWKSLYKCMTGLPDIHISKLNHGNMHALLVPFVCTAITIHLNSGDVVNLDGLICSDPSCSQVDISSMTSFIDCINSRNYANIQCVTQTTEHIFFCSKTEEDS